SINSFDNTIHNIFLHSTENGKDVTTVAKSGHLEEAPNGDQFIVLEDGRRYEGQPGTAEFRTIGFERLGRRIEPAEVRAGPLSVKALPTDVLIASGGAVERAELFWRLSVPISAVVLVLLAIPLSYVNPRMGRSFNLISAAFMYMVYNNCVNFVQSVIAQDKLSLAGGLILTHSVAIAVVFFMFWNRLSIPGHIYELVPTAALIGTLSAISGLVANSEYTVMRSSGASLTQITLAIVRVGVPLAIATFLAGEFLAPPAERLAQQVRLQSQGQATRIVAQQFASGFWFKQDFTFVNIRSVLPDMTLLGVSIYEFDRDLQLKSLRVADSGSFVDDGLW